MYSVRYDSADTVYVNPDCGFGLTFDVGIHAWKRRCYNNTPPYTISCAWSQCTTSKLSCAGHALSREHEQFVAIFASLAKHLQRVR